MNSNWAFQTFKAILAGRVKKRIVIAALTASLVVCAVGVKQSGEISVISLQPAFAQLARPQDGWRQVYQSLPDFPRENQYVSKETGKVDPNNTLAARLIRYHLYVKSRPPNYRLDWKLTLADYLGANEYLVESVYPGYDSLRNNPMEGDRAAIKGLNRAGRDALVNVLVRIFNPNYGETPAPTSPPTPTRSAAPAPNPRGIPKLPQPGDAQLLKP